MEPDRQARLLRLAVLRRRQHARAHGDPLELRDELVDRPEYDCSLRCRPTSSTHPPGGGDSRSRPTTAWPRSRARRRRRRSGKSLDNQRPDVEEFGDLTDGGMQPITGPIYRYNGAAGSGGRFPGYWDGGVADHNRGADNGFWKEVRLRKDNNQMLRVQDFLPTSAFGADQPVIGTLRPGRRAVHDALGRLLPPRARRGGDAAGADRVQRAGQVPGGHAGAGRRSTPWPGARILTGGRLSVDKATLTISAGDAGCSGVDTVEYRVNSDAAADWQPYTEAPSTSTSRGACSGRLPRDRRVRQRLGGRDGELRRRPRRRQRRADRDGSGVRGRRTTRATTSRPRRSRSTRRTSSHDHQLDRVPRQPGGDLDQRSTSTARTSPSRCPGAVRGLRLLLRGVPRHRQVGQHIPSRRT